MSNNNLKIYPPEVTFLNKLLDKSIPMVTLVDNGIQIVNPNQNIIIPWNQISTYGYTAIIYLTGKFTGEVFICLGLNIPIDLLNQITTNVYKQAYFVVKTGDLVDFTGSSYLNLLINVGDEYQSDGYAKKIINYLEHKLGAYKRFKPFVQTKIEAVYNKVLSENYDSDKIPTLL